MKTIIRRKGNDFTVQVFDEEQMIPDPRFVRNYTFGLNPKQKGETEKEFRQRTEDHILSAQVEAERLYAMEMEPAQDVEIPERITDDGL